MQKIIENSKKVIKESTKLSMPEIEKKKIELEARTQLFGTAFGFGSSLNEYCSA